jgi:uncharacterized protein YegJ (DUF2314 family)
MDNSFRTASRLGAPRRSCLVIAFVVASAQWATALAEDPNPVPKVPKRDAAMSAAFAKAAAGLDDFLANWRHPPRGADRFVVKIGLMDVAGAPGYAVVKPDAPVVQIVEWFWAGDLKEEGTGFSGRLSNKPESLYNVAYGQTIHFTRQDIGDWMYQLNGKIVGNATACPALAHASVQERRAMKEQYGIDCD